MECTVVSFVPFSIWASKPGLSPCEFSIPPSDDKPSLLNVKDGFRLVFDQDSKPMDFPVPGEEIAGSIVNDYVSSLVFTDDTRKPAIFWVPGKFENSDTVEKTFKDKVVEAKQKQSDWFKFLVSVADDDWQLWHQHKVITDMQRHAAKSLNLKREWVQDNPDTFTKCASCMTLISVEAAVCFACKAIINQEKYSKFTYAK